MRIEIKKIGENVVGFDEMVTKDGVYKPISEELYGRYRYVVNHGRAFIIDLDLGTIAPWAVTFGKMMNF